MTVLALKGERVWPDDEVSEAMAVAARILRDKANVDLVEHGRKVVSVDDSDLLDAAACDASQLFNSNAVDLTSSAETVGKFSDLMGCGGEAVHLGRSALVVDYVNIIFIRQIVDQNKAGCHISGTDYVLVARSADVPGETLAHELGHAGDLWHIDDNDNLVKPGGSGIELKSWQVCLLRRSRFVTYMP